MVVRGLNSLYAIISGSVIFESNLKYAVKVMFTVVESGPVAIDIPYCAMDLKIGIY